MKARAALWAAAALAAAAGACSETTFEGGGPLSIDLKADRTAVRAGQDVTFTFEAVGSILDGVVIRFGDGSADTTYTAGAQGAGGRFVHAYGAAGTYAAVATVFDGRQGSASDTVVIAVTGG